MDGQEEFYGEVLEDESAASVLWTSGSARVTAFMSMTSHSAFHLANPVLLHRHFTWVDQSTMSTNPLEIIWSWCVFDDVHDFS